MTRLLIIMWVSSLIVTGIVSGYLVKIFNSKQEIVQTIKDVIPMPVVSKPVVRDTSKVSFGCDDIKLALWHYDNDPVMVSWKKLEQDENIVSVKINGSLYERKFEQEAFIPISTLSGNWKLGLGIGIGAVIVGGGAYCIHRLRK